MRAAILLLLAFPLRAATTVTLLRDGVPVAGEVCRFAAGSRENPFERWLSLQDVTCAAAGSVEFPSGSWNVFGKAAGAVSTPVLIDAPPSSLTLTLDPAATLVVRDAPRAEGRGPRAYVVYAARRGSAFPVVDRVSVPAGEALWLFVLEKSKIAAVVPIAALEAGSERVVDARTGGPSAVIGWIQVSESDRAALRNARGVSPPQIQGADPLPPLELLSGAFVRVRDVPAGEHDLELRGRGWIPNRRRANVSSAVTVISEPFLARPAGSLIVNWSTDDDLPALDRSLGSCEPPDKPPHFEISVAKCARPARPNEGVDPKTCSVIRTEPFEPRLKFGSFRVEDVVPGFYQAEMHFGKLPPVSSVGSVPPLQQTALRIYASYIQVYGSLTRGGEPVGEDAALEFVGNGVGFATKEKSEYAAVLRTVIGMDARIEVAACDGAPRATVLTDRIGTRNSRFDIDLPLNELAINVSDTFTRMALGGATVRYMVMSQRMRFSRPIYTRTVTADDEGRVLLKFVPAREIRLNVSHPGYQKQDVPPFSMTRTESKSVDVQLVPLRGNRAKIHSEAPFESGSVYWFAPSGVETERAELASDGTFFHASSHDQDETMAVVSASHPVWAFHSPKLDGKRTVDLRFPPIGAREFDVVINGGDRRDEHHIGVIVGGVRIPQPALQQHQFLRGLSSTVRARGEGRFREIAETGPIEVVLGPTLVEVWSRALGMDILALPQFKDAPRKPLEPGATSVSFDLK